MTACTADRVTVVMAFVRLPKAQSSQVRGRAGEPVAYTYYRCMAVAFASFRRFNPDVPLVLVTNEPLPEPFAGQLADIGVETLITPFAHRPPRGFGQGWESSLFLFDAMAALRGRGGTQLFSDPDQICVRPLGPLLAAVGDAVGAQKERIEDLHKGSSDLLGPYRETCAETHQELGEESAEHPLFGGHFYLVPEMWADVLLERIERAWRHSLDRHARGRPHLWTDEHFMNYALRGVPWVETSDLVRSVPTAPWRRFLTDRETILGLTLWHLIHEKDLGFQRLYRDAVDPGSWFWTVQDDEFRERVGAVTSATRRTPQRALLNAAGDLVEKVTTERMQHRLKPGYTRMVQLFSSMRLG